MTELMISFEFFPPKTPDGNIKLQETVLGLTEFNPDFFSVTYGAGGSTRDRTIDTLQLIRQVTDIPVAPHISCMGATKAELVAILQTYRELGVKRTVALRGDLPSGMGQAGELRHASELVKLIRETVQNDFHIEVAAYPEFHPQANNARTDLQHFREKVEAGANSAITQYFFNPDAYFYFLDECVKLGIFIPIVPGIMPITSYTKLARFSAMCGAEIPRWLTKKLESFADDQESLKKFGEEVVFQLCEKLLTGGAPGLHFYTLNQLEATRNLCKLLQNSGKLAQVVLPKSYIK